MSHFGYRPDIDGLRTLAVLPVVAFHFNLPFFTGGFVGVDVFFVISGFLITRIIAKELEEGSFSLLNFYRRRVLRLLPALFVVLLATLVCAYLWFVPEDFANTGQSAIAALFFSSNILFFLEAGYFDASSYTKPLLHTWSLAIEEQFYLFMPLLLMLLWRLKRGFVLTVLVLTGVSLALSAFTTERFATGAYYLLPWRAWELGLGALLALGCLPVFRSKLLRELSGSVGIVMILAAVFLLDRTVAFPGVAALLPTVGAMLILHAGNSGGSMINTLLSMRLPVEIGRLSYSLYLWHWPVVVFFTYIALDLPNPWEAAGLFVLSLLLSWLSYRFVETPFRKNGTSWGNPRVFIGAGAAAAVVLALSASTYATRGFPNRLPPETARISAFSGDFHPDRFRCRNHKSRDKSWGDPCIFGPEGLGPTVALIGDSHANALVPALELIAEDQGFSFALLGSDGCPGFRDLEVYWTGETHSCGPAMNAIHDWLADNPEVTKIVFMIRPALYVKGWLPYGMREYGRGPLMIGDPSGPAQASDRYDVFATALRGTIEEWRNQGRDVVLIYPLPEAANHIPNSLTRHLLRGQDSADFSMPRAQFDERNAELIKLYDELVSSFGLAAVRFDEAFCGADVCPFVVNDVPIYHDSNHLSATHARNIAPLLAPPFGQSLNNN